MKVKIDISDKEKNILYRLFAVILSISNVAITYYSSIELDRIVKHPLLQVVVGMSLIYSTVFSIKAILNHYKYPNK